MAMRWIPAGPAPPEERWSDVELLSGVQDEMARVRARLARLTGRDPAARPLRLGPQAALAQGPERAKRVEWAAPLLPTPVFPVVLRLSPRPPAPAISRNGIVVAPGWGER
jgi:hypothetical protein